MSDLILYHGTIAEFSVVDLKHCKDKKDFGKGFYTTTDAHQAITLAKTMRQWEFIILRAENPDALASGMNAASSV